MPTLRGVQTNPHTAVTTMNNLAAIPGLYYVAVGATVHIARTTVTGAQAECGYRLQGGEPWHGRQPPNTTLCLDCLRAVDALQFNAGGQRQRG